MIHILLLNHFPLHPDINFLMGDFRSRIKHYYYPTQEVSIDETEKLSRYSNLFGLMGTLNSKAEVQ